MSDEERHPESAQIEDGEDRQLPVLAEVHPIEPVQAVPLPVAVAAATGGFVLGVAAFVAVRILRRPRTGRRLVRSRSRLRGRRRGVEIAHSRSFLVDVHLLKDR